MTHIVVTGGTGFFGRHFVQRASAAGIRVTALTRRPDDRLATLGVEVVPSALGQWPDVRLSAPADAVVHFAAATSGSREHMLHVARQGVRSVIALCLRDRIPRLVHISSLSVYGQHATRTGGDPVGDLDPGAALRGAYAHSKVEAERALHAAIAAGETEDLAIDVVRPGLVFGWEMQAPLGGTAVELPLGLTVGLGRRSAGVPVVHIEDASAGLLGLLGRPPEPTVRVHDLLSGSPPPKEEFLRAYEELTGRAGRPVWVPRWAALAAGAVAERALGALGQQRNVRYAVTRLWDFDPRGLPWEDVWREGGRRPAHDAQCALSLALSTGTPRSAGPDLSEVARELLRVVEVPSAPAQLPPLVFVGAGRVVRDLHLPALEGLEPRVAAIVDPNPEAREAIATVLRPDQLAGSLDELANDTVRDATAVISTPGFTHGDLAQEAMRRGMNVLLEKPATITSSDLGHLEAAALENGSIVTVFQNYRLRPNTTALWHFLANHDVGPLLAARVAFHTGKLVHEQANWMRHGELFRVLPLELGVHFVDICCVLGGRIENLERVRVDSQPEGAGTTRIEAQGQLEGGAWITLDLDATGTARRTSVTLEFERAAVELAFFPEGFRILPAARNPLDDAAYALRQFAHALRQQIARRAGRSSDRGTPHRAIYREHARRLRGRDLESPFSLSAVAPVTESLCELSDHLSSLPEGA